MTSNKSYNIVNHKIIDGAASNNYWGTAETSQIDAKIFDYYDNINYGKIIYNPYLASPDTTAPISPNRVDRYTKRCR